MSHLFYPLRESFLCRPPSPPKQVDDDLVHIDMRADYKGDDESAQCHLRGSAAGDLLEGPCRSGERAHTVHITYCSQAFAAQTLEPRNKDCVDDAPSGSTGLDGAVHLIDE